MPEPLQKIPPVFTLPESTRNIAPRKWMLGRCISFLGGPAYFLRAFAVSFRECNPTSSRFAIVGPEAFNSHITENAWILSLCLLRRLGLRPTTITWNTLAESNAWQVSLSQREAGFTRGQKSAVQDSNTVPYFTFQICIIICF